MINKIIIKFFKINKDFIVRKCYNLYTWTLLWNNNKFKE